MQTKLDHIECFEEGSGEPSWTGLVSDLKYDLETLQRLAHDGVIRLDLTGNVAEVAGTDRVGLVVLPSGRRLVVRSKIESLTLLDWLGYLGEFPPLDLWLPESGVTTGDDFHTCIARLFLFEIEKVTRFHLRKDYTPIIADGPTVRGHILATRLSRQLHRLPRVPQRIRSRTFNTPYNIVLALALDRLPVFLANSSANDRKRLANIRDLWGHVQRTTVDPVTAVTEAQWASPHGYRAALQLARLILAGVALDPESRMGGRAFTMSLALIWERSLRRMIDDIGQSTGWVSLPDSERSRPWGDSDDGIDPARWLTTDVLMAHNESRWVLDAKYKRAFGNESRSDRFQMCAYAVRFDADRVSLVYPTALMRPQHRILLKCLVGGKQLVIDSIELPMCAGPEACKDALLEVCQSVGIGSD